MHGATCQFSYTHEFAPTNWQQCVDVAVTAAINVVGAEKVDGNVAQMMISEDFGAFLQNPGCFIFLGNGDSSNTPLHNACYDFNDEILLTGAEYLPRSSEPVCRRSDDWPDSRMPSGQVLACLFNRRQVERFAQGADEALSWQMVFPGCRRVSPPACRYIPTSLITMSGLTCGRSQVKRVPIPKPSFTREAKWRYRSTAFASRDYRRRPALARRRIDTQLLIMGDSFFSHSTGSPESWRNP